MDLNAVRTALIVTLSIAVVVLLWRKFRRSVMANDMPAILHAEVLTVEVMYHPARLRVHLHVPDDQAIHALLLDVQHAPLHHWDVRQLQRGQHSLEYFLPELADGLFHLEVRTATQRTERQFRLQQV